VARGVWSFSATFIQPRWCVPVLLVVGNSIVEADVGGPNGANAADKGPEAAPGSRCRVFYGWGLREAELP